MDTHERILVVGGGIFGLSTAHALAREGYAHVDVLERDHVGAGATALAAGIVSLHTWNDEDAALILRTRELVEELVAWGRNAERPSAATAWHPVGGLTVCRARHAPRLEAMWQRMRRLGLEAELLPGRDAERRFSKFKFQDDETALWGAADGYAESTDLLDLVRHRARGLGVRIREGVSVDRVHVEGGRASGVAYADGRTERSDRVVVAGGAWTRGVLRRSGVEVAAIPYRTQLATLEMTGADALPVLHDASFHFYARPESSTRLLAGDGTDLREFDPDGYNRAADAAFVESTAARIMERFRDGANVRYRSGWAGLCVGTPDQRPLAGPILGVKDLYVLTGDNGFGLMRGLALGEIVAASVAGRADPRLQALRPDRFQGTQPFPLREGFSFPD